MSRTLFYCTNCQNNFASPPLMKGNIFIELILWCCWLVPGLIYSIWRRSGQPNVCRVCKTPNVIPAQFAQRSNANNAQVKQRQEKECPHCAEMILVKATVCKHCGKSVV